MPPPPFDHWGRRGYLLITAVVALGLVRWAVWSDVTASSALEVVVGLLITYVVGTLCLRYGTWSWLAAAAAAPTALTLGQLGLANTHEWEAIFALVVCVALLGALWQGDPRHRRGRTARRTSLVVAWAAAVLPFVVWAMRWEFGGGTLHEQATGWLGQGALIWCLVLGLAASVGLGRADRSGMRLVCLLVTLAPVGVLWATTTNGHPQWHDHLVIALLPVAGALGLTAILRGHRGPAVDRAQLDDTDRSALADFAARYGEPALAPVVILIAAYNEADGLPDVLATMPRTVCGLPADVVVVDDKSTDATAERVVAHPGVYLVAPQLNRGQGAALRLGYRIARTHGAQYVITTDADGQYDPADFPTVLQPIVDGDADFVTGSRRKGHQETHDRFRRLGVHIFAWIISAMTGRWTTDTSFGLRAMRAEATEHVTLNQPQYQASELLLGMYSHGYRVREVPGRMLVRSAGSTKKGSNSVYGRRYAGVVFGTWWREGCPVPVTERAPALLAAGSTAPTAGSAPPETGWRGWAYRNRIFLTAFGAAVLVRVVVMLAYSPAFIHSDARTYLPLMDDLVPDPSRPVGYGILVLRPVAWFTHDTFAVAAVQHLLGLASAALVYALLRRWEVKPWVATLAAAPLLFDAMQLLLEHTVLSDVLFDFLVVASIAALAWRRDLDWRLVFLGGLLLGAATTVRVVGQPVLVVAVIFCLWLGRRWRARLFAVLAVVIGFAIPVGAYANWYHQEHGVYALTEFTGKTLYLRTTTFVECDKLDIPEYLEALCPAEPVGERRDPTYYVFSKDGTVRNFDVPAGMTEDEALGEFARAAIRAQPMDYLSTVVRDFKLNFVPERVDYFDYETAWKWSFVTWNDEDVRSIDEPWYPDYGGELESRQPWGDWTVEYEKYVYLAGPLLLGCLALGVAGLVLPRRNGPRGLRPVTFLVLASATGMLLVPDVTAEFVWRYQLPGIALMPVAAALAYTSLRRDEADQRGRLATASTD